MKWKKDAFGLGHGKKKNGSSKSKNNSAGTGSPNRKGKLEVAMGPPAPATPGSAKSNGPGLGTLRVGIMRPESAPICTPTPRAKRQLISDLLEPDECGEEEDTGHSLGASPALRSIISNKSSSGKNFDKEVGRGDSFSSYTPEEKVAFACHLNQHLLGDRFLKHLLPLDAGGADLFSKFNDGVLLCRLVCLAIPGSIVDSKINVPMGTEPLGLYKSTENLNVALKAAEAAGLQVVNIGASDIINARPASILGLSWQLIRVHLLAQINLKGCPDLIHLMEEGEEKEDFFKLPAEEVLLRWFNHHLRWGGSERRVSNFGEDLSDGKCYVTLIKELNDNFKGDESDWPDEDVKRAQFRRACLVISGAEGIGLAPLIRPRHINAKANLYNVAFVAQLLNRRPRIHRESLHLDASVAMQAWYRMLRTMHRTTPIIEERRASASTLSRSWRRWMRLRDRNRAATTLQAWRRGNKGRSVASHRRFVVAQSAAAESAAKATTAAAIAAAAREREAATRELEVAARKREAAARERERESAAATSLQAWGRGVAVRHAVTAALMERGLPPLRGGRQRVDSCGTSMHDSCGAGMKDNQMGQGISPRTSVSSSVRFSEDSPIAEERGFSFPGVVGGGPAGDKSRSWFDKVFSGISFGSTDSEGKPLKRQQAAAAIVIQRWKRQIAVARSETARAEEELAKRRGAVGTIHRAYADRWRFEVAARRERRQKWEEEAQRVASEKAERGWLGGLWAGISSGVSRGSGGLGDEEEEDEAHGLFGKRRRGRREKREEEGDCCDAIGQGVLASEIDAWKVSYFAEQVFGNSGMGKAQEERARFLSKAGVDDRAWTSPESALSAGKVVAMVSVLLTVLCETALSNVASVGS